MHVELFLEEPSAEAFLQNFLAKVLPAGTSWNPIVFQGKDDLLCNLAARLRAYRSWMPDDWRIVVLVDEDRQDCKILKEKLENACQLAGLKTKTRAVAGQFVVLNRIVVEELEAWFFGDPQALIAAFPRVPRSIGAKASFRDPDAVAGGTWEALERVLQRAGYYSGGLSKIELAREMGLHMDPLRNSSTSFKKFIEGLNALSR